MWKLSVWDDVKHKTIQLTSSTIIRNIKCLWNIDMTNRSELYNRTNISSSLTAETKYKPHRLIGRTMLLLEGFWRLKFGWLIFRGGFYYRKFTMVSKRISLWTIQIVQFPASTPPPPHLISTSVKSVKYYNFRLPKRNVQSGNVSTRLGFSPDRTDLQRREKPDTCSDLPLTKRSLALSRLYHQPKYHEI